MKQRILDALVFLRLVNGDGCLSLSNITVIVALVKLATAREVDFATVGALLTVIGGYNFKRYLNARSE